MRNLIVVAVGAIAVVGLMIFVVLETKDDETPKTENIVGDIVDDNAHKEVDDSASASSTAVNRAQTVENSPREAKEEKEGKKKRRSFLDTSREERIARYYKVASYLDELMESEPVDAIWSTDAIQKVKDTLGKTGIGNPHLVSVDCKSKLCKVEMSFDENGKKMKFLEHYGRSFEPWGNSGWVWGKRDESNELVIYFAKEGEKMPRVPSTL